MADEGSRSHAEYYLALAQSANLAHDSVGEQRHELIDAEQHNLRRALAWAVERREVELGLRLVCAPEHYWVASNPFEGRRWLELLLPLAGDDLPLELRARSLLVHGSLIFIVGEFERGTELFEASLELYRELGDELAIAGVLQRLAMSAIAAGDHSRAIALADESLELARRTGSRKGEVLALSARAQAEWESGGDKEVALERMRQSATDAGSSEVTFDWWRVGCLYRLCEWSLELDRPTEAERYGIEALEIGGRIGDRMHSIVVLALLARIAARDGRSERAGLLWGALEAEELRAPIGQWEGEREAYAAPVRAHAGPEFERGRERGQSLTFAAGVEQALKVA